MVLPAIEINQVLIGQAWVSTAIWIKALSPYYFAISRSIAAVNIALLLWAMGVFVRGLWPAVAVSESSGPARHSSSAASRILRQAITRR